MHFSRLIRSRVSLDSGLRGRLRDLAVIPGEDRWRVVAARVDERVISFGRVEIEGVGLVTFEEVGECVWLGESVLDRQLVDVHALRVARVSDLVLACEAGRLEVVAVELGLAGIARRLGLGHLAARLDAGTLALDRLHVASAPASSLTLDAPKERLRELEIPPLDDLVDRLPRHAVLPHREAARRIAAVLARPQRARRYRHRRG